MREPMPAKRPKTIRLERDDRLERDELRLRRGTRACRVLRRALRFAYSQRFRPLDTTLSFGVATSRIIWRRYVRKRPDFFLFDSTGRPERLSHGMQVGLRALG